jgi:hypothetical protein
VAKAFSLQKRFCFAGTFPPYDYVGGGCILSGLSASIDVINLIEYGTKREKESEEKVG